MAYNIFIDNAISYGYITAEALRADNDNLTSDAFIQKDVHSTHGNETLVGQNQKHIIAGALSQLSANYKNVTGKYGAMYIKIGKGNFNLSHIANDTTWKTFVDGMKNDTDDTNFTRIYKKISATDYAKVDSDSIGELSADDETKTDNDRFENHEYVLIYGYKFIRENGRNSIKVPMMPNRYSVFGENDVHVFVKGANNDWVTPQEDINIFANDVDDETTPTDYYGEFNAKVDLDGWITKTLSVNNRILTRKKWGKRNEYDAAQTSGEVGPYSILGKDNDNKLYIWFDEATGKIYLGTLTNATFDGDKHSDEKGDYITADGGNASIIVKPKRYYTFDDVDALRGNIRFVTETDGDTPPTIKSVTRDDNGNVTITLNGVIDNTLDDGKPRIIVPEPRQTKLTISAVYHKFDPFAGGNGNQQPTSILDGAEDLIFSVGGYNVEDLDRLDVAPYETLTDIADDDGVRHNYVYFGLSKGVDVNDFVTDGSKIVDTAIFNVADDENKALIEVNDNSVVYHLYYVDKSDLNAEVILTNVHEYEQAGPTDENTYLNNGSVVSIDTIPGVD